MEIVSKIPEPKLVWNIFTYVAEAPLTKERRKQIEEWGDWGDNPEFIEDMVADEAHHIQDKIHSLYTGQSWNKPLSIILKLFENQEYDLFQQTSEQIDKQIFDKWDRDNGNGFDFWIELCARRSFDVGVKLQLDYDIIPPRYWGIAEEEYRKEFDNLF